jgi:hypothetical protein
VATVKHGILTKSPYWWDHLRWAKKVFWRGERRAARRAVRRVGKLRLDEATEHKATEDRPNRPHTTA